MKTSSKAQSPIDLLPRYNALLAEEVRQLVKELPGIFTGGAPLFLSLFQPTPDKDGGRMVLIDKESEASDSLIWIKPGLTTHASFLDADPKKGRKPWAGPVDAAILDYYCKANPPKMRKAVGSCYLRRLHDQVEVDETEGHVAANTPCELVYVCPSPFAADVSYTRRVPKLGTLYTFNQFFDGVEELQAAAQEAANCILLTRLNLLLGTHHPSQPRSAFAVAHSFATRTTPNEDEIQYLVARLFMVHHFFYPQDQVAAILIGRYGREKAAKSLKATGSDSAAERAQAMRIETQRIWAMHGWPAPAPPRETEKRSDAELYVQLTLDLVFLISACASKTAALRTNPAQMRTSISKALPIVCAALCGSLELISIRNEKIVALSSVPEERFMMVRPSRSIGFATESYLPAFPEQWIKEIKEDSVDSKAFAGSVLEDMSGNGAAYRLPPKKRGKYARPYALIGVPEMEFYRETSDKNWLYHYVRSRCVMHPD